MRIVIPLLAAAGAQALLAASAWAASPASKDGGGEVAEVVVTAAPFPISIDSATTHIDILDRSRIDTAPAAGLGDMLNGLPGVRSTSYGPGASRPVVRGLSGPRVLVLENGVGLVDASTLSPDHAVASDPGQAQRIEVLRGPSTLAYGGSGIGGVVNVLDNRVPSALPERPTGRLSASGATVDDSWATSGAVTAALGRIAVTLDGSKRRSSDYDVPVNPVSDRLAARDGLIPAPDRKQFNTFVEAEAYGIGASYVAPDGDYLGASVKRTATEYGVPYAQLATPPGPDEEGPVMIRLRQTRYDVRGQAGIDAGPFDKIRLSAGYADYHHAEIGVDTGEVGTRFLSHGGEARIELVQREMNGWQGAFGLQGLARKFEAIGDEAFVPPARIREAGVFTLQRLDKGSWGVEGGLRLDRRSLQAPSVGGDRAFTNVSGSVGAFWRPAGVPGGFLSVSLSHNGRAPTEFELFANGPHPGTNAFELGDSTLKSERVNSAELTGRMSGKLGRLEAHLYAARYDGYIEEAPTGEVEDGLQVYRFTQTKARFRGAEVEAAVNLLSRSSGVLSLEGTYDVVRGKSDSDNLARIPPWSLTGALVWSGSRIDARAEVRRVGAQDKVAALELPTDGYTTLNGEVSFKPFADHGWRVFVQGRNLTDQQTREHASFLKDIAPGPGRSVRVGTTISF
jgi:iron complex outermembrane receptor protein